MLLNAIDEVIQSCQIISNSLEKGGLSRPSKRIEKIVSMLSALCSGSENEARIKLASKPYKNELEFLSSAVTDIKGLKDFCPSHLKYEDWRNELSAVNEALNKLTCNK